MKAVFVGVNDRMGDIASLAMRLRWPDATITRAAGAGPGLELVEHEWPDVVLMHPDFADMSYSQAIQQLRRFSNVPLLMLGHQSDEMEVVASLEAGADDYVRMPCDLTELTTRIWALLRRSGQGVSYEGESSVVSGQLLVNPASYEVFLGGERLALTTTEFRLLHLLVKNWGIVMSRASLERTLWGDQADSYGLVKKYIQRLRHKLGDDAREPYWIASVHGVGYRFIGPTPTTIEASVRRGAMNVSPEPSL